MKLGKYQHFRNKKFYEVLGIVKHSETMEEMVLYKCDNEILWVRPKDMFNEEVEHEGLKMPRFQYVGE